MYRMHGDRKGNTRYREGASLPFSDKSTKKTLSHNYLFFVSEINKIYFIINKIEIYI